MKVRILFLVYALCLGPLSFAQNTSGIEFIPITEELTQNTVVSLLQDRKGFLWIGTRNGVNKYDGINMISYLPDDSDPGSISGGNITTIYEDKQGVIWIGTYGDGLNRYDEDTDTFTAFIHSKEDINSISGNKINCIYEDLEGTIWVGTEKGGLNKLDESYARFEHYKKNLDDPFSISDNSISCIVESDDGELWIGTDGGGLNLFNRNTKRFIHYTHKPSDPASINSDIIRCMAKGNNGEIWIGSNEGVNRLSYDISGKYVFEEIKLYGESNEGLFNVVLSIVKDRQDRVWVGTENGGLLVLHPSSGESTRYVQEPTEEYGLKSNSIWSLLEDEWGFIWVGTYNNGLCKVNPHQRKFRHIKSKPFNSNSLSHNSVSCFGEDENSNIWIGTDGGGLNYLNVDQNTFKHYNTDTDPGFGNNYMQSLMVDSRGDLWAGFWKGGISILKKGASKFQRIDSSANKALTEGNIVSIVEDTKKRIWIAAFRQGLLMYNPKTEEFFHFEHDEKDSTSLSLNLVRTIYEDSDQNIWIGTEGGGVNRLIENGDSYKFEAHSKNIMDPTSISNDFIHCITEDSNKNLWVGTSSKLNLYDREANTFKSYGKKEGLPDEVIHGILEDENGNLWISTNKGIVRFNIEEESFKAFDISDGLQGDEFSVQSYYKQKNGELLFGGINGFNIVDPSQIVDNTFLPQVYLKDFRLANKSIKPGVNSPLKKSIGSIESIELKYFENDFSFEFAVLSFSQSSENVYAYQLADYDDDWQYAGNRRNAFYTNVSPGSYTFRVKGTNNDGKWSDKVASIKVTITPAWYQTFWAYGMYFIGILFFIWWGLKAIINRERLQARYQVEHLELSKMQELDEMKSRFFANISHEFRSPLTLILGPLRILQERFKSSEDKEQVSMMIRNAERLLKLINELLDLSRLESGKMKLEASRDNVVEFLKPIIKSFSPLANENLINYKIDLPHDSIDLYFDKEKLEKIVFNLLSNAFKYTSEFGKVKFEISKNKKYLIIKVSDSGIGIPTEEVEYIFNRYYRVNNSKQARNKGTGIGLSLTKELVELHKGKIKLTSGDGMGTVFEIFLPLGKEHLATDEIVETAPDYHPELKKLLQVEEELSRRSINEIVDVEEEELNNLPLVLVIDDHKDIRKHLRDILESEYRVIEAENGVKGIEIAKSGIPDLIISDVMMPGIDGYEVCKKLKEDVKTSHVPVILLTAKASNESAMEGFELGADYYITKPFDPKLIQLRVRNILKTRDQIRDKLSNRDIKQIEPKNVKIAARDQNFLNDAISIVEKNMSNSDFFVDDLGRELGLSRMQLYRKLKGLIGLSANEFVRSIRLKRAAQLLEQGVLNVSEITYEVGFNDLQYFRDCFKKQFGVNPSDYIENSKKVS